VGSAKIALTPGAAVIAQTRTRGSTSP
jgi:hypothetical protein